MVFSATKTDKKLADINKKRLQLAARIDHDQHLKPNDKLLARTLLLTHLNAKMNGKCNPSHETLITTTGGLSKSSIIRSSKQLKARGVFTTYQPGRTTKQYESCEYTFNWNWVGSCEWTKCKNCISTRERNTAMGVSLPPIPEKIMGVKKQHHGCRKNESWVSNQANHRCQGCHTNNVIETIEETAQRTTHENVCESASPEAERLNEGESKFPPKDSESSLHEKNIFFTSHEKGTSRSDLIPGIAVPRGQMGWVTSKNERPLRDWLVSMGLSQYSVDEMRWKAMVACFNDETNATINSLKQDHEMPGSLNNASADICGDYSSPSLGSCPKDLDAIEAGFNFWQHLMSGQAIVTVPRGFEGFKRYFHTILALSEDIEYFCSLTLRDTAAAMPHITDLQPTRAELWMAYYQLDNRGSSFPWSQDAVLSCIRQMQKETAEMSDKQTPPNNNDDDETVSLCGNLAS